MGAYSRGGLFAKNEFLGGGLFKGRAYSKAGGLFEDLLYPFSKFSKFLAVSIYRYS